MISVPRLPRPALLPALLSVGLLMPGPVTGQSREKPGDGHDLPLLKDEAPDLDTLAFTVDEATWLSLAPLPDGNGMVLEILGDLYTLPMQGGEATRITEGMGFDSQPAVSPDGEWVAFISDRDGSDNLWIAPLDPDRDDAPKPRKLSSQNGPAMYSPVWTPDSKYVIASRSTRGATLWMYHIDGGSGIQVTASPEGGSGSEDGPGGGGGSRPTELGAAVSPDGDWLYFHSPGRAQGGIPGWQISRRNLRTGETDALTQNEWSAFRPALSPDGTRMVYGTRYEARTGLRIRNLETGTDEWLVYPVQRDQLETGGAPARDLFPGYAFTPDGASVLYTEGGKIRRVSVADGTVSTIPFTAEVRLATGPDLDRPYRVPQGPVLARLMQSPRQSPDGSRVVMSVLTRLYVAELDDPGAADEPSVLDATPLDTDGAWAFQPIWSPDGRWIAYVTWATEGGHIWKRPADGSGAPQRLTDVPAFYTDLAWSPDGTRIVALRGSTYQRNYTDSEFGGLRIPLDLVHLPADGGEVELIVPARGAGVPHFVDGDPDRIWVYSREGLQSMRFDGTDRRTHLKVTGRRTPGATTSPPADEVILSPDGRYALASSSKQLYLVTMPPSTGSAPTVSLTGPSVPVKRLTDIGADYFAWADGGETLTWAIGSTFYRRPLDSVSFRDDEEDDSSEDRDEGADEEAAAEEEDEEAPEPPADLDESVEAFRAEITAPRAIPRGSVVLRGATLIPMEGDAEVLENHDLVVTDNRIVALGPAGTVDVPSGAEQIDASGTFIVPGFVDTHAHWEFRTHDVLEPHNWSLLANLAYGVTAGLDVQTSTNDYFAYQDLVETGQSWGQRAFMTGPGIFSSDNLDSYEEVLAYLRRYAEHYRTPNIKSYMVGTREQRQWVVRASYELGLMPTTEGGRNLRLDLTHSIDGMHGNEHTLPVNPLFEDVVQLFARTRTTYTPTLLVLYGGVIAEEWFYTQDGADVHDDEKLNRFTPHVVIDRNTRRRSRWVREDEHVFDDAAAQAAKIQRAGGLVGVGGHGQLQGLGYHWEMWALALGGMTPREVLQAATIDGARIIGIQQDLGSLAVGKLADLVVLEANPLDDIRNTTSIRWVMKNGELYEDETLTKIWPEREELPPLWGWEGGGPPR